jgi:UDP-N-acetylglucosamine--N-acetylmuramyl-(pentapeptide) pyrophosphoryl-undecaprenol N-acetylglucosamine transferase
LPALLEWCQVIHLTGEGELERVKFELGRRERLAYPERYSSHAFLMKEMGEALAAADVVVSRAGVNAITDVATLGKPTVLIPNYQMAGHQVENARVLSRMGAVRVLDGQTLTGPKLVGELKRLVNDPEEQERLSRAIRQFSKPEAARELAGLILEVGRGEGRDLA